MQLKHPHEIVTIPTVDKKTINKTVRDFIDSHGGQKPLSIMVGTHIMSILSGIDIPIRYASGLQHNEIVFLI